MSLLARIEDVRRVELERDHRDGRHRHEAVDGCPGCDRRPVWSRNVRAKELTR